MLILVDEKGKNTCSGCFACESVCPKECIELKKDERGFKYPYIDHMKCIKCGACDRICETASARLKSEALPKAYGMYASDEKIRIESSSGGIFTLLAKKVLSDRGVVIGAAMTDDFKDVHHIAIESSNNISALTGSKYLQSDISGIFGQVKQYLTKGKNVLFSGTPCQIDGLKAFLGQEYDRLLCVDIICHGVPSPMIWKKYCIEIEGKTGEKIETINFRHKKYGWERYSLYVLTDSKRAIVKSKTEDPYLRLFLNDFTLRPSCYNCSHKGLNRKSDITIADFWGVSNVEPELYNRNGTSLVLVHSDKGMKYIDSISENTVIKEVNAEAAVNQNSAGYVSAVEPEKAEEFWNCLNNESIENLADKYCPVKFSTRIKSVIVKSAIYRCLKR